MKKFLLLFSTVSFSLAHAQCPVTITGNTVICNGMCTTLSASGGMTYTWTPTGYVGAQLTDCPTTSTIYTVTATSGTCTATQTIAVTVYSTPQPTITVTPASCGANGSATVATSGGMPAFTYSWTPGGAGASVSNLSAGVYTVTVIDANGCVGYDTATVSDTGPTATVSTTPASCGSANGSATVTASGGSGGPYSYTWSPSGSTSPITSGLVAGVYTVAVSDNISGCTITQVASVSSTGGPTVTVNATDVSCYGACNGSGTVSVSGGSAPYTYTLMPGNIMTSTPGGLCPGSYTMGVQDNNGCMDFTSFTISQPPMLILSAGANPYSLCAGGTSILTTIANGGTPAYTYLWMPGSLTTQTITVNPLSMTMYTVTATDANACTSTATVVVNVSPSPSVNFSVVPNGAPHVWDIYPTYSGGSGSYSYSWDWGDGSPADTVAYPSHTYATPGNYNICTTLTDSLGCSSSACQQDSLYRNASGVMVSVTVINGVMGIVANSSDKINSYPNPANEYIMIESETKCTIELYDLGGKLVLTRDLPGKTKLDASELHEGVYTLRIKTSNRVVNQKLVVLH